MLIAAFLIRVRPMKTKILNIVEIMNEITFLSLIYFNYLFTDFEMNIEFRYTLGWAFLIIVAANVIINLGFIVYVQACDIIHLIRVKMGYYRSL